MSWTAESRRKARLTNASRKVLRTTVDNNTAVAFSLIASQANVGPEVLLRDLITKFVVDYIEALTTKDSADATQAPSGPTLQATEHQVVVA